MTRYLGIDYGTKRVGLAISDGLGMTAQPLEVVPSEDVVTRVRALVSEYEIEGLVVGLPRALRGHEGASAEGARALGDRLAGEVGLPVEYVDEKFTSRMAEGALLDSGMKRRARRERVDKVAAAIILQNYLDTRETRGNQDPS